jgi:hypothetical protein
MTTVANAVAPGATALRSSLNYRAKCINPDVIDDNDWGDSDGETGVAVQTVMRVDAGTQTMETNIVLVDKTKYDITPKKKRMCSWDSSRTLVDEQGKQASCEVVTTCNVIPGTWPGGLVTEISTKPKIEAPTNAMVESVTATNSVTGKDGIADYIVNGPCTKMPNIDIGEVHSVGYICDPDDPQYYQKYGALDTFIKHDKLYASAKVYGLVGDAAGHRLSTVVGTYSYVSNTVAGCEINISKIGGGCATLLLKGFLLCMIETSGSDVLFDADWPRSRGKKPVYDKWRLSQQEYELLRILNQPFPFVHDDKTVWSYVCVDSSNLDVGRPKGIAIGKFRDVFKRLIGKLGLLHEWRIVLRDAVGLCENLYATKSSKCKLDGLSDGFNSLTVADARGASVDIDFDDLLVTTLIQGDELMVIKQQSGRGAGVDQWNCLLRTSIIKSNGKASGGTQPLSRAILCAYGFESVVFPENVHCGMSVDDRVIPWLNSLMVNDDLRPTRIIGGYPMVKGCVRVIELSSLDTYAIKLGWANFDSLIKSKDYAVIMVTKDGLPPLLERGNGVGKQWILMSDGKIAILSHFGRVRHRLTLNEHKYGGLFDRL